MSIIKIAQGELSGETYITNEGFKYVSYCGIPYAKPPIGDLRFKDPQPHEGWSGIRDASVEGNVFIHIDRVLQSGVAGSEDALVLNVNTPFDAAQKRRRLPVMVWIHGGGFSEGSGNRSLYGCDYLVQQDVILVTINYRLGVFGFLCLNTPEVPGNAGLKDQVMALRWVRDNIGNFGGDKDNVTIFGESAGAASVNYLMISPLAEGLFHKAIIQSGSCFSRWAMSHNTEENAFLFAQKLGAKSRDKQEIFKVLSAASGAALSELKGFYSEDKHNFCPVVEHIFDGVQSIITEPPLDIIKNKKFKTVPCMIGHTLNEGVISLPMRKAGIEIPMTPKEVDDVFKSIVPKENFDVALQALRKVYFAKGKSHIQSFVDLHTDVIFAYGSRKLVDLLSCHDQPVYFYIFGYDSESLLWRHVVKYPYVGAAHTDELAFLFKLQFEAVFSQHKDISGSEVERKDMLTKARFAEMWSNFAKCGNPTPEKNDIIRIKWQPATSGKINCLMFNSDLRIVQDPLKERMDFWRDFGDMYDTSPLKLLWDFGVQSPSK